MNLLLLTIFAAVCVVAVQSRYPYEDTYGTGDIVPSGIDSRYPYDRDGRGYPRKHRSGYGGYLNRRGGYGRRYEDDLYDKDYRRRHRDYDSYLPPRGLGGYRSKHYGRPDYDYGRRRRTQVAVGPPKYFDEDEFVNADYNRRAGVDVRLSP